MNVQQLEFSPDFDEAAQADEHRRGLALDRHRQCVQTWFDGLTPDDKEMLGEWFTRFEFETCVALAAAAGGYRQQKQSGGTHIEQPSVGIVVASQ